MRLAEAYVKGNNVGVPVEKSWMRQDRRPRSRALLTAGATD